MLEPAGKIGHVIASPIQQQYNFLLLEKVSKMVCLLNSCEVADFWILSCAAGIYVIVWRGGTHIEAVVHIALVYEFLWHAVGTGPTPDLW